MEGMTGRIPEMAPKIQRLNPEKWQYDEISFW